MLLTGHIPSLWFPPPVWSKAALLLGYMHGALRCVRATEQLILSACKSYVGYGSLSEQSVGGYSRAGLPISYATGPTSTLYADF